MSRALAPVLIAVLAMSGCALLPSDRATPTALPEQTDAPEDSIVQPHLDAVIVVAGLDPDGANVSVSGYVAGILEIGGDCRFSLASGDATVDVQSTGEPDRSVTSCGLTQVPADRFTRGTWTVTMTYESLDGASVDAEPMTMEIP